jgi:hypothetical protein
MVEPAESLGRKDTARSYGTNPAVRCSLPESEIRAVVMIVADIIREQPFQMAFSAMMVSKESEPTSCRLRVPWRSFHPTRDRSLREIKAGHEVGCLLPCV